MRARGREKLTKQNANLEACAGFWASRTLIEAERCSRHGVCFRCLPILRIERRTMICRKPGFPVPVLLLKKTQGPKQHVDLANPRDPAPSTTLYYRGANPKRQPDPAFADIGPLEPAFPLACFHGLADCSYSATWSSEVVESPY